jgi:hypothetical protein
MYLRGEMTFNYKDLTYIRASIQAYEATLVQVTEDECSEDEFSEIQDDILYLGRLLVLVNREIKEVELSGPSSYPVSSDK